ncbi:hypothetical protein Pyn_23573 [Prunus yedoensis var. nudiflora]|uniref:Uncharacterized protein n=1 Tax=Prunus yedoensis var. nudiflora TaxID=2094558 RepID=A0A314XU98_PRUYE|nr:hypothetical protein Pyn_23573 [Prunus yedoensis var. nudiflora]
MKVTAVKWSLRQQNGVYGNKMKVTAAKWSLRQQNGVYSSKMEFTVAKWRFARVRQQKNGLLISGFGMARAWGVLGMVRLVSGFGMAKARCLPAAMRICLLMPPPPPISWLRPPFIGIGVHLSMHACCSDIKVVAHATRLCTLASQLR